MSQKKVLFVCYGSGHVRMVVPVAKALQASGLAHPVVMGLTTAAQVAEAAGLEVLRFRDFVRNDDAAALAWGRRLLADMSGPVIDPEESVAYLGLCYAELIENLGAEEAARAYARLGRQAFLPLRTLERFLKEIGPDLVFTTNSPRAERAAVMASRRLGLPAICLVDLFCIDEVEWIGAPDYADCICVLNESVKRFLQTRGRLESQVVVTGNPAFDQVNAPAALQAGRLLREVRGWQGKRVVLWPLQVEPAFHPVTGKAGDVALPDKALDLVARWALARPDIVLCIRVRAGAAVPKLPASPRIVVTGQEIALPALLHAVDFVATLNSTVGLEGHLAGLPLVQLLGSLFDESVPLGRYGIADESVHLDELLPALERCSSMPRRIPSQRQTDATGQVLEVVRSLL